MGVHNISFPKGDLPEGVYVVSVSSEGSVIRSERIVLGQ